MGVSTSHRGYLLLLLLCVVLGCERQEPIDAGATRAFWTDVSRNAVSLNDASTEETFAAADALDRLSIKGVDPKAAELSREMSVLYRRMAKFRKENYERGERGEGLKLDKSEIQSLSDESNRVAQKMREVDTYIRDTYHY